MPKTQNKPIAKSSLRKGFATALKRSDAAVVPPAYQFLFDKKARSLVCYGGRGAGRSWSYSRVLILKAMEKKTRILCAREFQSSISESVHQLLSDQIDLLGFGADFEIQTYSISGRNGSEFIFEGLRHNVSKIKSLEGIDVVWIEEGESISDNSWGTLIPTIRKSGSQIWVTFNPYLESDPTYQRFVVKTPPNSIVVKTTYLDNPFFPQELDDERLYLQSVDDDSYRWIWLGECRTVSDALILKGKFIVDSFAIQDHWSGPHHGVDFGFSLDENAAVRLYIDDITKTLYVKSEQYAKGVDIDILPSHLEAAIPGISSHVVFCDSSRPETISYLRRNGIPRAVAAEKWSGSVNDGVAYLRSFKQIIIDPSCKNFLAEARTYSFEVDRLSGLPLPQVADKHNHLMDATRYALSPLIRNLPTSGFFGRPALLSHGQPVDSVASRPDLIFGVLAVSDRPATAVGLVVFARSPHYGVPLTVLDYDLAEIDEVLTVCWLEAAFDRMRDLARQLNARTPHGALFVEGDDFGQAVAALSVEHAAACGFAGNLLHVHLLDAKKLAPTLDQRALSVRSLINGAAFVKFSRSAFDAQLTHRNVTANHLLSQVLGYRADTREGPLELVNAFVTGIAISAEKRI